MIKVMKVGQGILIDYYGIVSRHGNQTSEKSDWKNYIQFSRVSDLIINRYKQCAM